MSNRYIVFHQTQQLSCTKNTTQGVKRQPTESKEPTCELHNPEGSGKQSTERTLTAPQKHDSPISKRAKDFCRHFAQKDVQMANDHTKDAHRPLSLGKRTSHPQDGQKQERQTGDPGAPRLAGEHVKNSRKAAWFFPRR